MRRQRLRLVPALVALALLAASCATPDAETGPDTEAAPEPVAEQSEVEPSEPETDTASEDGEASEPEAEAEVAPSSTTSSPPEATTTTTLPADCDFSDHAADALAAVYQVVTSDGIGTAFYLGDGEWLTAAHVVGTASRVSLHNERDSLSVAVKGIDHSVDLALLEGTPIAVSREVPTLTIMEGEPTQPGEAAIVVGYPLYREDSASISQGVVSRYEEDDVGELLVTDASVNPGNSGGPMLNECGEVIGVVRQKYVGYDVEGLGYAISVSDVTANLPRLRQGFKDTPPSTVDAVVDPTPAPSESQGWVITDTEPDLLTGEVFPYMFVLASDVEREYDFYEIPSLASNCWGEWSVWWGGDTLIAYDNEVDVVYRVGAGEALTDVWIEDDELTWLSMSATDAILAADPDDELVVRAYDYDGDIFATAVFDLDGFTEALGRLIQRCSPVFSASFVSGESLLDLILERSSHQWLRYSDDHIEAIVLPGENFSSLLWIVCADTVSGLNVLFQALLEETSLHSSDASQHGEMTWTDTDGSTFVLSRIELEPPIENTSPEMSFLASVRLASFLSDLANESPFDEYRHDGWVDIRFPSGVTDTLDVTRWHEAKEGLLASCSEVA